MTEDTGKKDRRGFLTSALMCGGLAAGYGLGALHFLRYLVPMGREVRRRELFVAPLAKIPVGSSRAVTTPSGESFVLARTETELIVLSDVCPHLGCKVHWKPREEEFLCPCHMGVFDRNGRAVSGPPAEAGQDLTRLPVILRGENVYVLIESEEA